MEIVKKVTCYGIRHGDREKDSDGKGLDDLSETGFVQVRISARKHLAKLNPVLAVYSGANRTLQTVQTALSAIGREDTPVQMEQGFNFNTHDEDEATGDMLNHLYLNPPLPTRQQTVAHWMEWAPKGAFFLRGQISLALIVVARNLNDGDVFLAGSHSPTLELAAPDTMAMLRLDVADIVCYEIGFDKKGFGHILSAEHLPCPSAGPDS